MPSERAFVSSRLPVALRDRLKAFAVSRGQSVQDVVERAVTRLLDEEAREPPALPAVLRTLRDAEAALRQEGVSALWVFGSVARGDGRPDSDVDLAVEFARDRRPTLFTLGHLQELIEQYLGTKVDIGLRRDLRPHIVPTFERDAVRVF
ncbi:MAG TPA: nucleotidyltransferase domain-containing protein [Acetobacteraceae bacterium]|nr:nucleotidyltransferase domain-containing protein [Acetobacteraceae bacterium]